jgi:predicted nucleotidyltransferase
LRRLGELAHEQGTTLEVSLYGGAVFTLVYGSRDSTEDVDAVVRQSEIAGILAARVARELSLPDDWLNDHVKFFLAEREAKRELPQSEFGKGLRISVPTAAYLLAMKLRACRPPLPGYAGDFGDIRFLVEKMQIGSLEAAEVIHDKFFPHDALSDAAKEVVKSAIKLP